MKKLLNVIIITLVLTKSGFSQAADPNLGIIPAPKSVNVLMGQFALNLKTQILFENEEDQKTAMLFREFLKDKYQMNLTVNKLSSKKSVNTILFSSKGSENIPDEGYKLNITPSGVHLTGKEAGMFYGFQSLIQLFPIEKSANMYIPCAEINDEPRFKYRGMHLDVTLHFFPVSFVKKFINMMAEYKLNTFHWHLTEDQGWRIEIKKYPELTKSGAWRAQTLIGSAQKDDPIGYDNTPHGGFYSQDEIRDVIKYASERHITIIPEIELPGHCISALVAYPHLACGDNPGPFKTIESWGIYEDVFCAGKESTFEFLENVLTEVMELFPSKYIHIGGDEVPKTRWKSCKHCQKRIKDNNLKDEYELQSYFVQRIEKFINSRGRAIIGWDEILEGGLAPNATVMSWRGEKGGIAAAQQNHDVIMAPNNYIYFDHYQAKPEQEPIGFPGYNPLERVYSYDPVPQSLTAEQKKHILGAEACVWTEYMATPAKVEYMILPRLLAFSEITWTPLDRKNYQNFQEERLPVHLAKLDKTDVIYFVPTAIGADDEKTHHIKNNKDVTITLKSPVKGAKIFYTFNHHSPRETDYLYEKPIVVNVPDGQKRVLKTIVITPSGKRSNVTKTIFLNASPQALNRK